MRLTTGLRRGPSFDPAAAGEDEALAGRIRTEIRRDGPMTFARFMDLALYDADGGYYRSAEARPGPGGDFLTAPETHPIFGHVLARQITEVWERLGRPAPFVIREHGAGTGTLAEAILGGLRRDRSDLLAAVLYDPVEVDPRRIASTRERLDAAGLTAHLDPPEDGPIDGVVLANEVLDALPVHRVGRREGRLLERYVAVEDESFVDAWGPPSTPALERRLADEGIALVDGQDAEVSLALGPWVESVAADLRRGLLLVIDYGAPASELYDPVRRRSGTLRAYVRHHVHDDPYRHIGRQDLTAHVDVTAVERAAHAAGLTTVGITTQAEFLLGAGVQDLLREVQSDPATDLASYTRLRSALMRMIDPAAMGRFRVMAFGRAWPDGPELSGFAFHGPGRP